MKGVASSLTSQLVNQGRISPVGEGEFQRLPSALLNFLCCVTPLVGRWEGHPTPKNHTPIIPYLNINQQLLLKNKLV